MLANEFFVTGTFPEKLRFTKVIPFYKTVLGTSKCSYTQTSLLSVFGKLFEKLITIFYAEV